MDKHLSFNDRVNFDNHYSANDKIKFSISF